jgi:uncharacterized DUF497 family protein
MKVTGFIWLRAIIDKLARKHNVTPDEVEQVFYSRPQFKFAQRGDYGGENLYSAWGCTDEGRYLIVLFILKADGRALVISARDMDKKERRRYGRR